ncbi:MAG: EamA family transporter [archaeon]
MTPLWAMILVAVLTIVGAYASVLLKKGAATLTLQNVLKLQRHVPLLFGIGLHGISTIVFVYALQFSELSILYPITSLSYIWVALLSTKFLKERMNLLKWTGILCIILGVVLIIQ